MEKQLKETYSNLSPILHSTPFPFPHSRDVKSLGHLPHPNFYSPNNHKLVPSIPHSPLSYLTTAATPTHFNPSPTSHTLPVHIVAQHAPQHPRDNANISVQNRRPNPWVTRLQILFPFLKSDLCLLHVLLVFSLLPIMPTMLMYGAYY